MKNKDKILNIIKSKSCGITVKGINSVIGTNIDKTTVYRNISKLLDDGIILEDFSNSGEKIYSIKKTHHHHFVCNKCGENKNIGCFFDKNIRYLEDKYGFSITNHSFVLNGICLECKKTY